jgi:hypothetical protein
MEERQDNTIYKVVMNHEEQYSIWPAERENALGWKDVGTNVTCATRFGPNLLSLTSCKGTTRNPVSSSHTPSADRANIVARTSDNPRQF